MEASFREAWKTFFKEQCTYIFVYSNVNLKSERVKIAKAKVKKCFMGKYFNQHLDNPSVILGEMFTQIS